MRIPLLKDPITVSDISPHEIDETANTLFCAFQNDPMMQYIFDGEENYQSKGPAVIKTWIAYCVRYGKAFRTSGFESVGIRRKPGDLKMSLWRILRSGMIKTPQLIGKDGLKRIETLEKALTEQKIKNMGNKKFWYCWVLGTKPEKQGYGFGSAIMRRTFELAKNDNLPCYLETVTESALSVHKKKGYQLLSEFLIPDSQLKIFCMLKQI